MLDVDGAGGVAEECGILLAHDDDGGGGEFGAEGGGDLEAGEFGKREIQQDDVGAEFLG